MGMTPRQARMALCALLPMAAPELASLVAQHGPVDVWQTLTGLGEESSWGRKARAIDIGALEEATRGCEARFVTPDDEEWPPCLSDLDHVRVGHQGGAPLGLWARGTYSLDELAGSVSVVGARAASSYGERVATDLAVDLSGQGHVVVSGLAYGIDAAAHRGAVLARRPTVAVVAGGPERPYPTPHGPLMADVLRNGAVVSEAPPGTSPMKAAFLARNRLIAALSDGVVVVEAAARSGARNTAAWAAALGRVVMAVPGPVTSSLSATPHWLVREQMATLVTSAVDIHHLIGGLDPQQELPLRGETIPLDRLTGHQRSVREVVGVGEEVDPGVLSTRTGLTVPDAWAAADELAEQGWLEQSGPGRWRLPGRKRRLTS